mgnify:CR=1 FL=1
MHRAGDETDISQVSRQDGGQDEDGQRATRGREKTRAARLATARRALAQALGRLGVAEVGLTQVERMRSIARGGLHHRLRRKERQ